MATRRLEVTLPMEMVLRLKLKAATLGMTVSELVEQCLRLAADWSGWPLESEKREVSQ